MESDLVTIVLTVNTKTILLASRCIPHIRETDVGNYYLHLYFI